MQQVGRLKMAATLIWYLGPNGTYASEGRVANDPAIASPPGPREDYWYNEQGSVWVPKTHAEKDTEQDNAADNSLNGNKHVRAIELWIAELHGLTPQEARAQLKAHFRSL